MAIDNSLWVVELVHSSVDGLLTQERLQLAPGATVAHALQKSRLLECQPGILEAPCGIWGRLCEHDQVLRHQDRVEIYRPLALDPKEARRQRYTQQVERQKADRRLYPNQPEDAASSKTA